MQETDRIVMHETIVLCTGSSGSEYTFQYVPLLKRLEKVVSQDDVFAHVFAGDLEVNDVSFCLNDYCDGDSY